MNDKKGDTMSIASRETITHALKAGRVLLCDGAWGTQLQARGLRPGECPEAWNETHPDAVRAIAADYAAAGADIVETNSFGGNAFKLGHFGLAQHAFQLNRLAAALSREGAGERPWVAASLSSSGKMLVIEEVTQEQLYEAFKEQALAFEQGGANAVCVETMSDAEEAQIAVRAVKENTALEVLCTFTFDKTAKGEYRTMMGLTPEDALRAAASAGADVVGANCGSGMHGMLEVAALLRAANAGLPLMVQANAGLPQVVNGQTVFPADAREMAEGAVALARLGVGIIGGCCGTTPEHIRAMRAALDAAQTLV